MEEETVNHETKSRFGETIRPLLIALCVGLLVGAGAVFAVFQTGHRDAKAIISDLEAENLRLTEDLGSLQGRVDAVAAGIGETQGRIVTISAGIGGGLEGIEQALLILEELADLVERIEGIVAPGEDPGTEG